VTAGNVEFGLLGPLLVRRDGTTAQLTSGKQRVLLAALLLDANRAVPADDLVAALWDQPPTSARVTLQNYVKRLRQALRDTAPDRIVTRPDGYLITVGPDELDTARFDDLVRRGRTAALAGSWDLASGRLRTALALWRGRPLADVFSDRLRDAHVPALERALVDATEWCVEADLRLGRHTELVAELERLVAEHPLRERLHGQLMLALYRCDRQADALAAYRRVRQTLVDELGVEPGQDLRRLHHQILTADPALTPAPARAAVPAQLPADLADFTGRDKLVAQLTDALTVEGDDDRQGVVVSAVAGGGGVGKTSLAVHVAHRIRDRFPDGQLYADLGGTDQRPVTPEDVLARFLRGLGIDPATVPPDPDERAAAYRSVLSDRRVLIVLDNARDAAQVRPLLPGTASCRVVVTSRVRLLGLSGTDLVDLDVLGDAEARELFGRIVGPERVAAEPAATGDVIRACAGLPLAIRIAAHRLVGRTGWTIRGLADRLDDERRRLDELSVGDLAVRGSFAVSYHNLPAPPGRHDPRRCFRLLGLAGADVTIPAVCALVDDSVERVERAVETLVDANLVQYQGSDRYRLHDLLRVYAAERVATDEPPQERTAALGRLHGWYLRTAAKATRMMNPGRRHPDVDLAEDHLSLDFDTYDQALAWLDSEHANLVATVFRAEPTVAWQLAIELFDVFQLRGHFADWIATHRAAIDAARRLGDQAAEGWLLSHLSVAFADSGDAEASIDCLRQSLRMDRATGNRRSEAVNLTNLGYAYIVREDYEPAIEVLTEAMAAGADTGHVGVEASAANNIGDALMHLDRVAESVPYFRRALQVARDNGMRQAEGYTLTELADAQFRLGSPRAAIDTARAALGVNREVGNRPEEANTLRVLGRALLAVGDDRAARECLSLAEAIRVELDLPVPD
jgi:DNA-binding SARP family transcriptional activator/tetratricopeptide (TPR) repeat protein